MMIECKNSDDMDLRYSVQERAWKQVHKVEIYFDTEKERDEFAAAVNAGDLQMVKRGRWEPRKDAPGFARCSACKDCNTYDEWPDGRKWRFCPHCGAHMEVEQHGDN